MVKFGICTDFENIEGVAQAGFDYIEPKAYDIAQATEQEFSEMRKLVEKSSISCEAVNFFYPLHFRVVGDNINEKEIREYIETAAKRTYLLGVKNITVGSGGPRRVPDGFSKVRAELQFGVQVRYLGELAGQYDMTVAIEPLRPESCNIINNIAQGAALARLINLPNVKTMADINQMMGADDFIGQIYEHAEYIGHLHTIDAENTCYPVNPDDLIQRELIRAYLAVNPGGRISIEGAPFSTVENAQKCLEALKSMVG